MDEQEVQLRMREQVLKFRIRVIRASIAGGVLIALTFTGCEVYEYGQRHESYRVCMQEGGQLVSGECIR